MRRFVFYSLLGVVAIVVVAIVVVKESRYMALGLLRGEGFQDGWPASYWATELKNPEVKKRTEAAKMLSIIGGSARIAVPDLVEALKDPEVPVRQQATFALYKIGAEAREIDTPGKDASHAPSPIAVAVPALTQLLDDEEPVIRMNAAMALSRAGADAASAVPAIRAGIHKPENNETIVMAQRALRHELVYVLGCIGPDAKDAVPDVLDVLQHARSDERWVAFQALERILGEDGKNQAIAALKASMKDPDAASRLHGVHTVREMEFTGPEWEEALVPLIKDDSPDVRLQAAMYLMQLKYKPEPLAPVFADALLTQSEQRVRQNCFQALMQMGPTAREAVPTLCKVLKSPDPQICIQGADLLGRIGPGATAAIPALNDLLNDKRGNQQRSVSAAARDALKKIDVKAAKETGL